MSQKLDLGSLEGLEEIASAVERFRAATGAVAESARERLATQFRQIELRGRALEEEAEDAQRELDSIDEDDCGDDEREQLEDALRQMRSFREAAGECAMLRRRFEAGLGTLTERGGVLTAQCARSFAEVGRDARTYRSIQMEGSSAGGSAAVTAGLAGAAAPKPETADRPPGVATPDVGPPLPEGFAWLDLATLSEADFLTEPGDFKKEGAAKIEHGIGLLRDEILPLLAADPALDHAALQRMDGERGTLWDARGFVHTDSLSNVWQIFFDPRTGADTLCVARKGVAGKPYLPGGRHRLGIARQMGIRYMPARVVDA